MQVITIVQTKGGSGKTTTAMLLASAALNLGRRVTLIDGDVNAQLGRWRDSFELAAWEGAQKPEWPESLAILSPPESVEGLLSLLEAEEARGVDLVVIDTRPGTHTDTEDFCLISDLVLIPARPVYAEWEMTHRAVLWMDDLRASIAEGERFPSVRVLVMDAGPKIIDAATREGGMAQLPKRDQDVLQEILRLDHLDVIVPHSRILEQLGYHGPLGPAARANAKAPGGRLLADAITRQLEVAELVLTGIDEVSARVDDESWIELAPGPAPGEWQGSLPATGLGLRQLWFRATDGAGNTRTQGPIAVCREGSATWPGFADGFETPAGGSGFRGFESQSCVAAAKTLQRMLDWFRHDADPKAEARKERLP